MKQLKSYISSEENSIETNLPRTVVIIPANNEEVSIAETVLDYINAFSWAQIVVVDKSKPTSWD